MMKFPALAMIHTQKNKMHNPCVYSIVCVYVCIW